MNLKTGLLLLLLSGAAVANGQSFKGQVLDSLSKSPIPYADIYIVELQTGTNTDENGDFSLPDGIPDKVHLQISSISYQTGVFPVDLNAEKQKTFLLSESHLLLSEVVVSTTSGKLQQDNIVSVAQRKLSELKSNAPSNLTEAISNIPGVDNFSTGSGIGKPVIRGLSGNRIVTYAQNVRIENQQWGDEHGLGVGEVGIENVEVIKGPASLLYGADALGGVLFFVDERYAPQNTTEGFVSSRFLSNNLGSSNEAGIKTNINGFKTNIFGAYTSAADYRLPGGMRALNTRFDEKSFKANFGYNSKNWVSNLRYSFLDNGFGITEEAEPSDVTTRKPELPFQQIANHLVSFENTFFMGDTKLSAVLGYNLNNRKEFEDDPDAPALDMGLQTLTYNLKSTTLTANDKVSLIFGLQGMRQQNENSGEEILIPNAHTNDIGGFGVFNYSPRKNLTFEGGVRADNRRITTEEMATDEAFFPALDRNFSNFNFSAGASYRTGDLSLRANLASGFRAPNSSELLSNGVHEGTLRYEIGDKDLKSEKAVQVDFSLSYDKEHFSFYINPFYNHINDYIYLSPSDSIIEDTPVYFYRQSEADLYGSEAGFHWHPHPLDWLHVESNFSSVFARDKSGNALPLIPANKVQTSIRGEFKVKGKIGVDGVFIEHIYRLPQNRIAAYETASEAYNLVNAGFSLKAGSFDLDAGVKNLFDTQYIDHLSRFRELGIPNPGINAYIGLKWGFSAKAKD